MNAPAAEVPVGSPETASERSAGVAPVTEPLVRYRRKFRAPRLLALLAVIVALVALSDPVSHVFVSSSPRGTTTTTTSARQQRLVREGPATIGAVLVEVAILGAVVGCIAIPLVVSRRRRTRT